MFSELFTVPLETTRQDIDRLTEKKNKSKHEENSDRKDFR